MTSKINNHLQEQQSSPKTITSKNYKMTLSMTLLKYKPKNYESKNCNSKNHNRLIQAFLLLEHSRYGVSFNLPGTTPSQYSRDWLRTTYLIAYHQVPPRRNCSLEPRRCLRFKRRDNPQLSLREPHHPLLSKHISTLGPSCAGNLAFYRLCVRSSSPLNVCRGHSPLATS
jgi:hypothetical protein